MKNYILNRYWEVLFTKSGDYILLNHIKNHLRIKSTNGSLNFFFEELEKGNSTQTILNRIIKRHKENEIESLKLLIKKLVEENFLVPFNRTPTQISINEYSRFNTLISWFDSCTHFINKEKVFKSIRNAHVTIIGLGGVGSLCAMLLAASGIGNLTLIDGDFVETSNLVRQPFYTQAQAEKKVLKTTALRKYLKNFTSFTNINILSKYLTDEEQITRHIVGTDIVLCTADNPRILLNRMINKVCVNKKISLLYCMLDQVGPFFIPNISSCFNCLEKKWRKEIGEEYEEIVEALQINSTRQYPSMINGPYLVSYLIYDEILNKITGINDLKTINTLIRINSLGSLERIRIERDELCDVCNKLNC